MAVVFYPQQNKCAEPRARYSKDASGHEHASDSGQFTGSGSSGAASTSVAKSRKSKAQVWSENAYAASGHVFTTGKKNDHLAAHVSHGHAEHHHTQSGNHEQAAEHAKHKESHRQIASDKEF